MKKVVLALLLLIALCGTYVWFFVYNKAHANIQDEEVVFTGSSKELKSLFIKDDGSLDSVLLNKVVVVSGTINASESKSYILDESVLCYLDSSQSTDAALLEIKVKGRLIGVNTDDIMYNELVVLQNAIPLLE